MAPGVVCRIPCFLAIVSVFGIDWIPFINSLATVGPRMISDWFGYRKPPGFPGRGVKGRGADHSFRTL